MLPTDKLDTILRRKTETFNYVIKGHSYQVSEAAYDGMIDHAGNIFTVYFAPKSRFLLSIEPSRSE